MKNLMLKMSLYYFCSSDYSEGSSNFIRSFKTCENLKVDLGKYSRALKQILISTTGVKMYNSRQK